jgi:antitoxin PrlF
MTRAARLDEFEETSTVTEKGQTTVPKSIRQRLGISPGDKIVYRVDETGISLRRAATNEDDPVIGAFLSFLAKDMAANPSNIQSLSPALQQSIASLVGDVEIDMDAKLEGDIDL